MKRQNQPLSHCGSLSSFDSSGDVGDGAVANIAGSSTNTRECTNYGFCLDDNDKEEDEALLAQSGFLDSVFATGSDPLFESLSSSTASFNASSTLCSISYSNYMQSPSNLTSSFSRSTPAPVDKNRQPRRTSSSAASSLGLQSASLAEGASGGISSSAGVVQTGDARNEVKRTSPLMRVPYFVPSGPASQLMLRHQYQLPAHHENLLFLHNERAAILSEIAREQEERRWYVQRIELIQRRIETVRRETCQLQIPLQATSGSHRSSLLAASNTTPVTSVAPVRSESGNSTTSNSSAATLHLLETELSRVEAAFSARFGMHDDEQRRHAQRLSKMHQLEKEMLRLQQQQRQCHVERLNETAAFMQNGFELPDLLQHPGHEALGLGSTNNWTESHTVPAMLHCPETPSSDNDSDATLGASSVTSFCTYDPNPPSPAQSLIAVAAASPPPADCDTSAQEAVSAPANGTELLYSLLNLMGSYDIDDMSRTLLAMSSSPHSYEAMRKSGCLNFIIHLLHQESSSDCAVVATPTSEHHSLLDVRQRATQALRNLVHNQSATNAVEAKQRQREIRVLRWLESVREHCARLNTAANVGAPSQMLALRQLELLDLESDTEQHPTFSMSSLMRLSFEELDRQSICTLGGLQSIAELLRADTALYGLTEDPAHVTLRRYACMALTNLTFGDGANKSRLCAMHVCLAALVQQLESPVEDMRQVAASVIRNLSWRADSSSKLALRQVDCPRRLMAAALNSSKESSLKSILSALWNLSAHSNDNKADLCAVDGALDFLVACLTYKSASQSVSVVENCGGILRNISSVIAANDYYRNTLRRCGFFQIMLCHLRSSSLTIVSNACGTLWNLSARCAVDQQLLWQMGAVPMLKNLVHSKHKMISQGSAAALKNLLMAKPHLKGVNEDFLGAGGTSSFSLLPSLSLRKQRALEVDVENILSDTNPEFGEQSPICSSPEVGQGANPYQLHHPPPVEAAVAMMQHLLAANVRSEAASTQLSLPPSMKPLSSPMPRSASMDSMKSVHSDMSHERHGHGYVLSHIGVGSSPPHKMSSSAYYNSLGHSDLTLEQCLSLTSGTSATASGIHQITCQINDLTLNQPPSRPPPPPPPPRVSSVHHHHNRLFHHHHQQQQQHQDAADDELLTAFDTEDTPHLSTAVSITDLHPRLSPPNQVAMLMDHSSSGGSSGGSSNSSSCSTSGASSPQKAALEDEESPHNFGAQYGEGHSPNFSASMQKCLMSGAGPKAGDKPRVYAFEGTPIAFSSRASSLSSISEVEERNSISPPPTMPSMIEIVPPLLVNNNSNNNNNNNHSLAWSNSSKKRTKLARIEERADSEVRETAGGKREKTVTFADKPVQDTPLMFSRCSSLGSLESFDCDGNSVHSSLISDYSRRTSAAVSPTELPDSPCDSPPPGTTPITVSTSAAAAAVVVVAAPMNRERCSPPGLLTSVPVLHDESTYFRSSQDVCAAIDDSSNSFVMQSNAPYQFSSTKSTLSVLSFDESASMTGMKIRSRMENHDMDTGCVFATEGTPQMFSEKSSLSGLSFAEEDNNGGLTRLASKACAAALNDEHLHSTANSTRSSSIISSDGMSEEMLAECIKSALPMSDKLKASACKSTSDSHLQSRLPRPVQHQQAVAHFSPHNSVHNSPRLSLGKCSAGSDTSSLAEESSDLLSEVIQSAMPKARPRHHHSHRRALAANVPCDLNQATNATSTWDGVDSPRLYQVEGTPFAHSRRDSLSSPSLDGEDNCSPPSADKRAAFQRGLVRLAREGRVINSARISGIHQRLIGNCHQQLSSAVVVGSGVVTQSPQLYATEDTPAELSYNSPLSSLHTSGCHSPEEVRVGGGGKFCAEPDASSLSSVSIASGDHSLLEACINSAMPQPRPRSAPAKDRHRIILHSSPSTQQMSMQHCATAKQQSQHGVTDCVNITATAAAATGSWFDVDDLRQVPPLPPPRGCSISMSKPPLLKPKTYQAWSVNSDLDVAMQAAAAIATTAAATRSRLPTSTSLPLASVFGASTSTPTERLSRRDIPLPPTPISETRFLGRSSVATPSAQRKNKRSMKERSHDRERQQQQQAACTIVAAAVATVSSAAGNKKKDKKSREPRSKSASLPRQSNSRQQMVSPTLHPCTIATSSSSATASATYQADRSNKAKWQSPPSEPPSNNNTNSAVSFLAESFGDVDVDVRPKSSPYNLSSIFSNIDATSEVEDGGRFLKASCAARRGSVDSAVYGSSQQHASSVVGKETTIQLTQENLLRFTGLSRNTKHVDSATFSIASGYSDRGIDQTTFTLSGQFSEEDLPSEASTLELNEGDAEALDESIEIDAAAMNDATDQEELSDLEEAYDEQILRLHAAEEIEGSVEASGGSDGDDELDTTESNNCLPILCCNNNSQTLVAELVACEAATSRVEEVAVRVEANRLALEARSHIVLSTVSSMGDVDSENFLDHETLSLVSGGRKENVVNIDKSDNEDDDDDDITLCDDEDLSFTIPAPVGPGVRLLKGGAKLVTKAAQERFVEQRRIVGGIVRGAKTVSGGVNSKTIAYSTPSSRSMTSRGRGAIATRGLNSSNARGGLKNAKSTVVARARGEGGFANVTVQKSPCESKSCVSSGSCAASGAVCGVSKKKLASRIPSVIVRRSDSNCSPTTTTTTTSVSTFQVDRTTKLLDSPTLNLVLPETSPPAEQNPSRPPSRLNSNSRIGVKSSVMSPTSENSSSSMLKRTGVGHSATAVKSSTSNSVAAAATAVSSSNRALIGKQQTKTTTLLTSATPRASRTPPTPLFKQIASPSSEQPVSTRSIGSKCTTSTTPASSRASSVLPPLIRLAGQTKTSVPVAASSSTVDTGASQSTVNQQPPKMRVQAIPTDCVVQDVTSDDDTRRTIGDAALEVSTAALAVLDDSEDDDMWITRQECSGVGKYDSLRRSSYSSDRCSSPLQTPADFSLQLFLAKKPPAQSCLVRPFSHLPVLNDQTAACEKNKDCFNGYNGDMSTNFSLTTPDTTGGDGSSSTSSNSCTANRITCLVTAI